MKKNIVLPLAVFLLTVFSEPVSSTVTSKMRIDSIPSSVIDSIIALTHVPDTMGRWMTKEQYEAYSDSIYRLRHPKLSYIEYDGKEDNADNLDFKDDVAPQSSNPLRSSNLYSNNHVPNSVSIDTNKDVGGIDIQSGISNSGARTYNIPIKTFSGPDAFTPSISLAYNSQSNHGVAGRGWDIGGLQYITRGSRSIYYDGNAAGQSMTVDDAFYLNGTRLICINSTDHIYQTETGHIMVKGNVSGNDYSDFEVYYPNGWKGTFGISSGIVYPITRLTNEKGQYISFSYYSVGTYPCIPNTISYADNQHYGKIKFVYDENKADYVRGFQAGCELDSHKLLKRIECSYNFSLLATYTLTHETDNSSSLLTQVDYSSNGGSLNPLRFYYGEENDTVRSYSSKTTQLSFGYTATARGMLCALRGRIDYGSGDDAIVFYPNENPYYQQRGGLYNYITNHNDANSYIHLYSGMGGDASSPSYRISEGDGFIEMLFADLDGQMSEFPVKVNNTANSNGETLTFKVYKKYSVAEYILYNTYTVNLPTSYTDPTGHSSVQPKYYFAGDFNGDGKTEVLAVSANDPFQDGNHPSVCYIFDLNNNQILYQGNLLTYNKVLESNTVTQYNAEYASDKLMAMDVDGDGKTDLCHFHSNGVSIYTFDINGNALTARLLRSDNYPYAYTFSGRYYSCGDFNGDGLVDMIASPNRTYGGTNWTIYASMGDGDFYPKSFSGPGVSGFTSDFCIQDIDGDGISDLAEISGDQLTSYIFSNYTATQDASVTLQDDKCTVVAVNINSSTLCNQFIAINGRRPTLYSYSFNRPRHLALTGVANSYGVVEKNYYYTIKAGDTSPNVYSMTGLSGGTTYPYCTFNGPLMLLAGNEVFMNGTSKDNNKYYYDSAVLNRQGLGFCGFAWVQSVNKKNQTSGIYYEPRNHTYVKRETSPVSDIVYTNDVTVGSNKILTKHIVSKSVNDLLTGATSTTDYTYDSYDNILTEQTAMTGGISVYKYNTYNNYTDISTTYRLGLPSYMDQTTSRGFSSHTESTEVLSYNSYNQPTTIQYSVNGFQKMKKYMTYDSRGNMTSLSEEPYSSCFQRTTSFEYDYFDYLKKVTDPLGRVSQYTYRTDGKVATVQTYTGTTSYQYDNLGRLVSETRPDSTCKSTSYAWTSSGGAYNVTTTETGLPTHINYYDALGREIRKDSRLLNNQASTVLKLYDNYGRLMKETLPYITGVDAPQWNTYTYDSYDRLTQLQEPSGRTTTYSYDGLETTTDDGTTEVTTARDALGATVSVTDPAGTVCYVLDGAGNPTRITVPGDIVTTVYYDVYGRPSVVNDPSKGWTEYTYDVFGNLMLEQDANSTITHYYYDNFGRMTEKSVGSSSTTYTYNDNLNQLTGVVCNNGTSKTFTYDTKGRLSSLREVGKDSVWLQKDYTYSSGRIASTAYTSSLSGLLATENYTYNNGHLTKVMLSDGTVVFNLNSMNAYQLPTSVTTGNYTRDYGYNNYGMPSSRRVYNGGTTYQDFSYTFNPQTGNLTNRTDNLNNLTENFSYDSMRRLTSFAGNAVSYDVKGNITSMGDVGSFLYNTQNKPYAISDVVLSNSISLGMQEVNYYPFHRPSSISENGNTYSFTYNGDYERVAMETTAGNQIGRVCHYLGGCYEQETLPSSASKEFLYLGGNYYDAPAVLYKVNNSKSVLYVLRDYLGSITKVLNSGGVHFQNVSYDAWGRLRNPYNHSLYTLQNAPNLFLRRGYCGHEHIPGTSLINMNARLYDPLIGRFLSPDPYIQETWNSQNYNRYSYCLNNPLVYKDENGEFFLSFFQFKFLASAVSGFVKGACQFVSGNGNIFSPLTRMYNNAAIDLKIDAGLFVGSPKQILSRLTWENFQTFGGLVASGYNTIFHDVDRVEYFGGATYVINKTDNANGTTGFTLGSYINMTTNEEIPMDGNQFAPYKHRTYVHEYGHYLQSQESGFGYIFEYAIPSFVDYLKNHKEIINYYYFANILESGSLDRYTTNKHHFYSVEIDANRRAAKYFFNEVDWPFVQKGYPISLNRIVIL